MIESDLYKELGALTKEDGWKGSIPYVSWCRSGDYIENGENKG